MTIDLPAATAFMATHARVLDRRRFDLLLEHGDPAPALAALDAYRNPDGGYGHGLEPDLRSAGSQPGAALHAFEVFDDIAPATTPRAVELCDWLASIALADGGLPFALPLADAAGCAPFWAQADPTVSSLQITAVVAAAARRVAAHDPGVAAHAWLMRAGRYCFTAIADLAAGSPHALALAFALRFLDTVHESEPEAVALLDSLAGHVPADGLVHVAGGTDQEFLRPLDFAPFPGRPVRRLFAPETISGELHRLTGRQQADGGWPVDFHSYSPAATLEWRGHMTVWAVSVLRGNGVV